MIQLSVTIWSPDSLRDIPFEYTIRLDVYDSDTCFGCIYTIWIQHLVKYIYTILVHGVVRYTRLCLIQFACWMQLYMHHLDTRFG